jgi:hypothetical protein
VEHVLDRSDLAVAYLSSVLIFLVRILLYSTTEQQRKLGNVTCLYVQEEEMNVGEELVCCLKDWCTPSTVNQM